MVSRATKRLSRETDDPEVKARIDQHVVETEKQIERLNGAFESKNFGYPGPP